MSGKVHRVKGKKIVKRYKLLPYSEIVEILKEDGLAFFEDTREQPLKKGTIWRAARKLSEMVGETVKYQRVLMRLENGFALEGYLFSVVAPQSQKKKEKRV